MSGRRRGAGPSIAAAALLLLAAAPLRAHAGVPPEPHDLWGAWSLEPAVLLAIGLSAMLYARGVGRLWRRAGVGRGVPRWRFNCFAGGLAALFVALVSPLDALGGALFSAHMAQHELLMLVAAPLLVLGAPLVPFLWALPRPLRRGWGSAGRVPAVRRALRALTHPVTAWGLYALTLWVWHAPTFYQATLRSEPVHVVQHASFLGAALLFWWILLHPGHSRRRRYGVGVIYLFTTAVHGSLLGALLTFAREPWYPAYAPSTPAWGLSPLDDQQLGGLIMWIPPGFLYLCAALVVLGLWLRRIGARDARRPLAAALLALVVLAGCGDHGPDLEPSPPFVYGGDADAGRSLIRSYGCGSCHVVPGVRGARGLTGPPLTSYAHRAFIAGNLANTPENLVAWIVAPEAFEPGTAMPTLGIGAGEARDIAAYLYTLR